MAQRALCWASLETLLWYSSGRYRTLGWTLKADHVQAYYVKDELSLLQGTQTKTPQENSRWKVAAGPSRALKSVVPQAALSPTAAPVGRWEKGFVFLQLAMVVSTGYMCFMTLVTRPDLCTART